MNPDPSPNAAEAESVTIASELPLGSFPARMPLRFGFQCFGIPFSAVADHAPGGPVLSLAGQIRDLPYSAESVQARQNLVAILEAACPDAKARFTIGERQEISIVGSTVIGPDPTPERIIAAVTAMLYPLKPYVDLMDWFGRAAGPRPQVS
ncbi:MAG: hypothetical protein AB7K86_15310 [Rhodospirillales bacterium]